MREMWIVTLKNTENPVVIYGTKKDILDQLTARQFFNLKKAEILNRS